MLYRMSLTMCVILLVISFFMPATKGENFNSNPSLVLEGTIQPTFLSADVALRTSENVIVNDLEGLMRVLDPYFGKNIKLQVYEEVSNDTKIN